MHHGGDVEPECCGWVSARVYAYRCKNCDYVELYTEKEGVKP